MVLNVNRNYKAYQGRGEGGMQKTEIGCDQLKFALLSVNMVLNVHRNRTAY